MRPRTAFRHDVSPAIPLRPSFVIEAVIRIAFGSKRIHFGETRRRLANVELAADNVGYQPAAVLFKATDLVVRAVNVPHGDV